MNKNSAEQTLLTIARLAEMTKGNGFRQFSSKKNGGAKNRNKNTWIDKLSRKVEPYFGDSPEADKHLN